MRTKLHIRWGSLLLRDPYLVFSCDAKWITCVKRHISPAFGFRKAWGGRELAAMFLHLIPEQCNKWHNSGLNIRMRLALKDKLSPFNLCPPSPLDQRSTLQYCMPSWVKLYWIHIVCPLMQYISGPEHSRCLFLYNQGESLLCMSKLTASSDALIFIPKNQHAQ